MNHINPDGKDLNGNKVNESEVAWGHVYSQAFEHCEARIVGNRKALEIIKETIERALTMPITSDEMITGYTVGKEEIFATDGEGYDIAVKLLPDNPEKQPMIDNLWDRYQPYYMTEHEK
jgi:hypothetical protein